MFGSNRRGRGSAPTLRWLAAVAEGWARQTPAWSRLVRSDTDGRWVAPLAINNRSEVWLQGWPVGEHIELHDHGGAAGALCVVGGRLEETFAPNQSATRLARRTLERRSVIAFDADHIHDVVNVGGTPALTIQVYTPRLVSMTHYRSRRGRGLEAIGVELSDHPEIVLTPKGWVAV
ncbi:MAG TPA: cysteine dioxygenase [Acidimicrobiia bacterium]|nr:cysteine dioxygenase [Acidimicrobiia bacterium]